MLIVVSLTIFALFVARLLRAPRRVTLAILGAALAALLGSQLLPASHPVRADVAASSRNLAWLAVALAPVAAYAVLLRRLRRRSGVAGGNERAAGHPIGLVQIDDDAALAAETGGELQRQTAARLGEAARPLSLAWRAEDGALTGHLRLLCTRELAEVEMLLVAPTYRRRGIARRLLAGGETLAREGGVRRVAARVGSWQVPEVFAAAGFRTVLAWPLGGGESWIWMEKELA